MSKNKKSKSGITVKQADKKGDEHTAETHGEGFYSVISPKGGKKVRKLIQEGKMHEAESPRDRKVSLKASELAEKDGGGPYD